MDELMLFSDGSVDTRTKIGCGAYLAVSQLGLSLEVLTARVKVKRFEETSSTKLELQTLLWALDEIQPLETRLIVHTDSQNIIGLPGRRVRLERNDYRSKNDRLLDNHELYRQFFRMTDSLDFELVKLRGHKSSSRKNEIDRLFSLVDRASRAALRS